MKLIDISRCHEDSPDFTASLSQLEVKCVYSQHLAYFSLLYYNQSNYKINMIKEFVFFPFFFPGSYNSFGEEAEAHCLIVCRAAGFE